MTSRHTTEANVDLLIRNNAEDLMRYFQRRLFNNEDAAEAYGELLLTVWKARRKMPADPTRGRMWLYVTARHILSDTRRALARRSNAVERLMQDARDLSVPALDDAALEVRDALAQLAEEDAELIRLTYWDGLTSYEAGVVLGLNASTVRSRLSRAKKELRESLETQETRERPPLGLKAAPM